MGLFDFLTGNTDPDPGRTRLSRDALYQRLLSLKDPAGRWHVRPPEEESRADLIAEWQLTDAQVIEWVRAAGERATKRVLLRLVDEESMVRSVDHDTMLSWSAELGHLSFEASAFRGQSRQVGKSWTFGGGETTTASWDTDEIKRPLREAVAEAGWGWHGVAFARL